MTCRNLLVVAVLAVGGVLSGGSAARATTMVTFTGLDDGTVFTAGSVDVTGSFTYSSTNNPLGYADLTSFNISFPNNGTRYSFDLNFINTESATLGSNFSTYFSFDPTTGAPIESSGLVMQAMASSNSNGFDIYDFGSGTYYFETAVPSDTSSTGGYLESLTFTTSTSAVAAPEPASIAILGVALAGLMVTRRRHGRDQAARS